MNLKTYRYGESAGLPGLSIGVTQFLPRGVRREDYKRRGYFDVWLPLLAPSRELVAAYLHNKITFAVFARRYRAEMAQPAQRQVIRLIAALTQKQSVNLGCFCEKASYCHRSILQKLVIKAAAELAPAASVSASFSSPACSMPEVED